MEKSRKIKGLRDLKKRDPPIKKENSTDKKENSTDKKERSTDQKREIHRQKRDKLILSFSDGIICKKKEEKTKMEEVELRYSESYYSSMANKIIRGKQKMTVYEAKIIRILIAQVKKEDENFRMYRTDVKKLAEMLGTDKENIRKEIRSVCKKLMRQVVEIENGDDWEMFHWISCAKFNSRTGIITLMLSSEIAPYILALKQKFTQYQTKNILTMKSFYAIRIYELLKMRVGIDREKNMTYQFSIKELRLILECENKFKQVGEFKRFVLDIAVKEISDITEYTCEYKCSKMGKTITDIEFVLNKKHIEDVLEEIDLDELIDQVREIIKESLKIKDYKAILKAANNDLKVIKDKYELAKKQKKIENLVGWMIKAIEKDYCQIDSEKPPSFNDIDQRNYTKQDYDNLEAQLLKIQ